jgi:hypothetical protein
LATAAIVGVAGKLHDVGDVATAAQRMLLRIERTAEAEI